MPPTTDLPRSDDKARYEKCRALLTALVCEALYCGGHSHSPHVAEADAFLNRTPK